MGPAGLRGYPGACRFTWKSLKINTIFLGPPGEAPPIPLELLLEHSRKTKRFARYLPKEDEITEEKDELESRVVSPKLQHYDKYKSVQEEKTGKTTTGDFDSRLLTVYTSIYAIRREIDGIRNPMGTERENPGRTCRDIHRAQPELKDGLYWIDPNLGINEDAFQAFCNMTAGGQTCIEPSPKTASVSLLMNKCVKCFFTFSFDILFTASIRSTQTRSPSALV